MAQIWQVIHLSEEIQDLAGIEVVGVSMKKRRLQWYGHVCRRDEEDIRRVSNISVEGKRNTYTKMDTYYTFRYLSVKIELE